MQWQQCVHGATVRPAPDQPPATESGTSRVRGRGSSKLGRKPVAQAIPPTQGPAPATSGNGETRGTLSGTNPLSVGCRLPAATALSMRPGDSAERDADEGHPNLSFLSGCGLDVHMSSLQRLTLLDLHGSGPPPRATCTS